MKPIIPVAMEVAIPVKTPVSVLMPAPRATTMAVNPAAARQPIISYPPRTTERYSLCLS